MTRRWPCIIAVMLWCLLAAIIPVWAERAWVLWVEAPLGADQWSVANVPQSRFETREECQKHADDLDAFDRSLTKMHGASGQAIDAFSCLPCTVDPRPEGALPRPSCATDPGGASCGSR